jgi:membrane protease subunit (stomatin/prohibitin family)
MKIIDPLLFVKNFVPAQYVQPNAPVFDFADMDNDAGAQLFNEVVGSLSAAFSNYTNDPSKGNRITKIQGDQIGFAQSLSQAVEDGYQWRTDRGLEIVKVALVAIEYDEDTKALLSDVKKADALSGARGSAFMQQSVARGMQAAGENPAGGGGMGMAFMGMGMNAAGGMMGATQQQGTTPQSQYIHNQPQQNAPPPPPPPASGFPPPPPPPPQVAFHVMAGGAQYGPFPVSQLQQMIQSGQLLPDSMVWTAGMASWAAAGTVPALASLFGAVPPPPPM